MRNFVRSCTKCQTTTRKKDRQPLQEVDVIATLPFQDISLDFVGCQYPVTQRKNKYLLSFIDNVTRWPHIVP